ncbi:hypothetical protein C4B68_11985 [Streptomyces dengpaensis]|uniref:Uncharacterized protein n=1 Tax=Streptomyces dengpaensis TaxID=2049881 RepID=A0ABN5I0T4_9ACTN|nr:hypothetical protein C4B68_11985 [Streptomyces dengpaensis]
MRATLWAEQWGGRRDGEPWPGRSGPPCAWFHEPREADRCRAHPSRRQSRQPRRDGPRAAGCPGNRRPRPRTAGRPSRTRSSPRGAACPSRRPSPPRATRCPRSRAPR